MTRYWKTIIATVTAIAITTVQAVQAAYADAVWTTEDTLVTVLAFLGAVLVYAKANTPPSRSRPDPNMSEQGYGLVELLVAAFFAVLIVYLLTRLL